MEIEGVVNVAWKACALRCMLPGKLLSSFGAGASSCRAFRPMTERSHAGPRTQALHETAIRRWLARLVGRFHVHDTRVAVADVLVCCWALDKLDTGSLDGRHGFTRNDLGRNTATPAGQQPVANRLGAAGDYHWPSAGCWRTGGERDSEVNAKFRPNIVSVEPGSIV